MRNKLYERIRLQICHILGAEFSMVETFIHTRNTELLVTAEAYFLTSGS